MSGPSDARRQFELFEMEYARMLAMFRNFSQVPPSREVIMETARRNETMTPAQVVTYWMAYRRPPR